MQQKITTRKISPVSLFIASICILVYIAALAFAVIRIYSSIDQRRDIAIREFEDIADLASSAGVLGFMDEPYIRTIEDALVSSETLEGLIISGPYGEHAFEKTRGQTVTWVNNSPRFNNRFDLSRQPLYMPLRIQNLRNVNIEGKAGALDYNFLSVVLKQTLFIILASLMLAFFTLLIESLLEKSSYNRVTSVQQTEETREFKKTVPKAQTVVTYMEESTMVKPAAKIKEKTTEKSSVPSGLYTPIGNIGWEEYTNDRLDSELQRCSSNEQDLVFLAMQFKDLDIKDEGFYSRFAEDTVNFFTLRDLIFERKKSGISVICPNVDLETAFAKSEEFHNRCLSTYSGIMKEKTDLCIGLSSRSGRIISADRLIFEANEALEKALADPVSHIIAFKSDPEKYRAYISSHNKNQG